MKTMTKNHNFESAPCMLCDAIGLAFVHDLRDDDSHWAAKCNSCEHIQVTPLPSAKEDEKYNQDNTQLRGIFSKTDFNDIQIMYRYEPFVNHEVDVVKRFASKDSSILEIGSGYGWLVEKLKAQGYHIEGIEISDQKRKMALERANIKLHNINLLQPPPRVL